MWWQAEEPANTAGNSCFPVHIQPSRGQTRVSHTVKTLMLNSSKAWPAHPNQSSWLIHPPVFLQATHMFIRWVWLPFSVCASSPSLFNLKSLHAFNSHSNWKTLHTCHFLCVAFPDTPRQFSCSVSHSFLYDLIVMDNTRVNSRSSDNWECGLQFGSDVSSFYASIF